jgi:hypothetical protein
MILPDHRTGTGTMARAVVPPAIVACAIVLLSRLPPAQYSFYPQCPIFEYLHLECPGCGMTRALAALLHGSLTEALHFNALVVLLLPIAAAYAILYCCRLLQRKPLRWPQKSPIATYFACVVVVLFTIVRNLPLRSF